MSALAGSEELAVLGLYDEIQRLRDEVIKWQEAHERRRKDLHEERRRWLDADDEIHRLRKALREIVACDYRGNMPREQAIARKALDVPPRRRKYDDN